MNGWYYTGDKVYRDDDGFFWFVGRDDDVIKYFRTGSGRSRWRAPCSNTRRCRKRRWLAHRTYPGPDSKSLCRPEQGIRSFGNTHQGDQELREKDHGTLQVPGDRVCDRSSQDPSRQSGAGFRERECVNPGAPVTFFIPIFFVSASRGIFRPCKSFRCFFPDRRCCRWLPGSYRKNPDRRDRCQNGLHREWSAPAPVTLSGDLIIARHTCFP